MAAAVSVETLSLVSLRGKCISRQFLRYFYQKIRIFNKIIKVLSVPRAAKAVSLALRRGVGSRVAGQTMDDVQRHAEAFTLFRSIFCPRT